MINVLCVSSLSPDALSGVVTYTKNLKKFFDEDEEVRMTFITVRDAPAGWARIAGLVRRFIALFAFLSNNMTEYSFEIKNRMLIHFALSKVRHESFDLIHAQDILSGHTAKNFFANKIRLVLTCHFNGSPVEEDLLKYHLNESRRPYLVRRYKRKFSEVDQFIFVSEYNRKKTAYMLEDSAKTGVIYNGLDFSQSQQKVSNGRLFSILNTGHVEDRKNQKLFIPIAKELVTRNFRDFSITIVGDGPALQDLKDQVAHEGLTAYFIFTGWSRNIDAYLKIADLYIHTSVYDVCPYSVIEAISSNVPALAHRVGGLPEMLDDEYLFTVNDAPGIAAFVDKHADRLTAIAARQFDKIKNDFSSANQKKSLLETYFRITGRPLIRNKTQQNFLLQTENAHS